MNESDKETGDSKRTKARPNEQEKGPLHKALKKYVKVAMKKKKMGTSAKSTKTNPPDKTKCADGSGDANAGAGGIDSLSEKVIPLGRYVQRERSPRSPFLMKLNYSMPCMKEIDGKYQAIMQIYGKDLQRYWVQQHSPRLIQLKGEVLQDEFRSGHDISSEVFCLIIRLMQREETAAYRNHGVKEYQW